MFSSSSVLIRTSPVAKIVVQMYDLLLANFVVKMRAAMQEIEMFASEVEGHGRIASMGLETLPSKSNIIRCQQTSNSSALCLALALLYVCLHLM